MTCDLWLFYRYTEEFEVKRLLFYYDNETDFYSSAWKWFHDKLFTAYRLVGAFILIVYFFFDYIYELFHYYKSTPLYWAVYATNWAFFGAVVTFIYLGILHILRIRRQNYSPMYTRIAWFFYGASANCVTVTCLVYWLALSDATKGIFSSMESRLKHSLPLAIVIFDISMSSVPLRLAHVIYPVTSGLIYTLFNMCFALAGGRGPDGVGPIYPVIDWDDPGSAMTGSMYVILVSFVSQGILFTVYVIRCFIQRKCGINRDSKPVTCNNGDMSMNGYGIPLTKSRTIYEPSNTPAPANQRLSETALDSATVAVS